MAVRRRNVPIRFENRPKFANADAQVASVPLIQPVFAGNLVHKLSSPCCDRTDKRLTKTRSEWKHCDSVAVRLFGVADSRSAGEECVAGSRDAQSTGNAIGRAVVLARRR